MVKIKHNGNKINKKVTLIQKKFKQKHPKGLLLNVIIIYFNLFVQKQKKVHAKTKNKIFKRKINVYNQILIFKKWKKSQQMETK